MNSSHPTVMHSFSLSWRSLVANPLRSLLTASAIALGVAMLLAASILIQATSRSSHQLAAGESDMDLQLVHRDNARFSASMGGSISELPGVASVAPSLELQAFTEGINPVTISLRGVEPQYAAMHALTVIDGVFLNHPDSLVLPEEIAASEGLSPGDHLSLRQGERSLELLVSGILKATTSRAGFASSQDLAAYLPLETAQTLADAPGQIDRMDIYLQELSDINQVTAQIQHQIGNDFIIVQTRPPTSFTIMDVLVQGLLGLVGLMILFASGFVIFNAFEMAVAGRRREIGALRCLGMTRRQVFKYIFMEAAYLALAGSIVGVLLGILLGWVVQRFLGTLDQVPFALPWWGLLGSPLIGMLITLVGALAPARQAERISPLEALRSNLQYSARTTMHCRNYMGWIILALTLAVLACYGLLVRPDFIMGSGGLALGLIAIVWAIIYLLPGLISSFARLFSPHRFNRFGASFRLALDGVSRHTTRSAATVMGLAIGPSIVIFMTGVMSLLFANFFLDQSSMIHEDASIGQDLASAIKSGQLSVDNFPTYLFAQPPIDPQLLTQMEALAAREGFEILRYGLLRLPQGGLPPMNAVALADLELYTRIGNFDYFRGDRSFTIKHMQTEAVILLTPGDAARKGVGLGDRISLPTLQGPVDFTVAGIGGNNLYTSFLDFNEAQHYFEIKGPTSLGIILPVGADKDYLLSEVSNLLKGYPMLAMKRDLDEEVDAAAGMLGAFQALLNGLMFLAVLIASLGVVNTITISISERGRELGMLRAVGATRHQVQVSVAGEAVLLGLLASILAAGLGFLLVGAFLLVLTPNGYYSMGVIFQWDSLPPALERMCLAIAILVLVTPLTALLAAWLPARQAAHLNVIEATRCERLKLTSLASSRHPSSR